MRSLLTLALMLGLPMVLLTACGGEDTDPGPSATDPAGQADSADHNADGHHDDDDGGHHSGPSHVLGTQEVGPYTVEVTQIGDEVEPGEPATFEIRLSDGETDPRAVRAWVGNEQAIGSVKVRAVDRTEFYDADLEVPADLPEESRVWVEIETEDGERHSAGFELHSAAS